MINNYYTKAPCFGCKDIQGGCKIYCEKYKAYEKIHEIEREELRKIRTNYMDSTFKDAQSTWKQESKIQQKGRKRIYGRNDCESEETEE